MNRVGSALRMGLTVVAAMSLACCGIRGPLEPAPPLIGPARTQYEAQKQAEEAARRADAAARAERESQNPSAADTAAPGTGRQTRQIPVDPKQDPVPAPQ